MDITQAEDRYLDSFAEREPEDIDVTDDREPVLPDEPTTQDFYMAELERIVAKLSVDIPYGYEKELTGLISVLENVLEYVRKPF